MVIGVSLLANLRVDDRLPLGWSVADVLLVFVHLYSSVMSRFFLLLSLPEATAHDVVLVVQQYSGPTANPSRSVVASEPAPASGGDPFDLAVRWLQRPCLSLGIGDQIQLRALYMQAVRGNAPEQQLGSFSSWLERAKLCGWRALRSCPAPLARERLPVVLARVDPTFASLAPHLALPSASGSLVHVVVRLVERRLPSDFDERVAQIQQQLLVGTAIATALLATLASSRSRLARYAGVQRWLSAASGLCGVSTIYFFTLVQGFPAWLHAAFLRQAKPFEGLTQASVFKPADPLASFWRLLTRVLLPRVSRPVLASPQDAQG